MTFHEAIREILFSLPGEINCVQLAELLNSKSLYKRRDGEPISGNQILLRVRQYSNLFKVNTNNEISLIDKEIQLYIREYKRLLNKLKTSNLSYYKIRLLAKTLTYLVWNDNEIETVYPENLKEKLFSDLTIIETAVGKPHFFSIVTNTIEHLTTKEVHIVFDFYDILRTQKKPSRSSFGTFFNEIANGYQDGEDTFNTEYSTPKEVANFISSIFTIQANSVLFDPFSGYCGSLTLTYRFNRKFQPEIIANDINADAAIIGMLNLLANNCEKSTYTNVNFLDQSPLTKVDLIVTAPPFGLKLKSHIWDVNSHLSAFAETLALNKNSNVIDHQVVSILGCLLHLKENGKAVIVVPDGVLFSNKKDYYGLRKFLIENRLLKGVISLPNGVFKPSTNISGSVLIIDKNSKLESSLFLFDASNYSKDSFSRFSNTIIEQYHNKLSSINNGIFIDYETISKETYDLTPKRYLLEQISDINHKKIKDLAEIIHTGTVISKEFLNGNTGIPFLQVGDLTESSGLNEVDLTKADYFISSEEILARNPRYIPPNAVLLAKVGMKLKPTLFTAKDYALCNPNIIVIKTDPRKLLPEYLITQLQSEYVLKQIDSIRHNIGVPHFSKADFLNVKIKILSIEDQQRFTSSFYGRRLQEAKKATERQREDDLYNIIASLKHELKQPVSSIGMDISVLKDFLSQKIEDEKIINWNEPVLDLLTGQTLEDVKDLILQNLFNRLDSAVQDAQKTLSKAEEILNIGSGAFNPEKVLLKKFLNENIKSIFANSNCTINIQGDEQELYVDKYQIEVLFKRLIENAIKHGFTPGTNRVKNIINIKLSSKSTSSEFHEIIVENNGNMFPPEFDISKFQTVGHTANRYRGTGFGGFHIKRIIESHKGEIHIADRTEIKESQFKVRFKIYLP